MSQSSTPVLTCRPNCPIWAATALAAATTMFGCTSADDMSEKLDLVGPTGQFSVRLTDAPSDGIAEVWVKVETLQLRACQGPWIHVPVVDVNYDLLALRDGVSAPLVPTVGVAPGTYCEMRLEVAHDGNYVVLDDLQTRELKVPSHEVKLKAQFEIAGGLATEVTLDLAADKSIKSTNSGATYVLHPIVDVRGINYAPANGALGDAHDYLGSTTLFVDPLLGAFYDLGGATIWFPPGAVSDPTVFSATRWGHFSEEADADLYHFYPPYDFAVEPILSISHTADPNVDFSVYSDGWQLDSDNSQDDLVETGVPHFCDFEAGRVFPDVAENHPQIWYINRMVCEGIMKGDELVGTFRPDDDINRAEFLKIVALSATQKSAVDAYAGGPQLFNDVDPNDWYHRYVRWGVENQIIDGTKDDFRPSDPVNRVEAIKILMSAAHIYDGGSGGAGPRLRELGKYLKSGTSNQDEEVFSDIRYYGLGAPPWYYAPVYAAHRANILGSANGTDFLAGEPLSRAEAAKLICLAGGHCALRELESRLFCSDPTTQCDQLLNEVEVVVDYQDPIDNGTSMGIDFSNNGEIVYAPASGLVTAVDEACGSLTIADEYDNVMHVLAHVDFDLDSSDEDQWIERGTPLGSVMQGQSPNCTTYPGGLHYERLHANGVSVDPYVPPSPPRRVPGDWRQVGLSSPSGGIEVYQKGHHYVALIDLRQARIDLLTGTVSDHLEFEKKVLAKTADEFIADAEALVSDESRLKIVMGGTFGSSVHYPEDDAPPPELSIAFGLQSDGTLISRGYGSPAGAGGEECVKDGQSYIYLATFNNQGHRAWTGAYNLQSFDTSPDIMGGMDILVCKKYFSSQSTARTVIATRDDNHDGSDETVVVFSSDGAAQNVAADELAKFLMSEEQLVKYEQDGVIDSALHHRQVMLDGSGSTFFYVDGGDKVKDDGRYIPQATVFSVR